MGAPSSSTSSPPQSPQFPLSPAKPQYNCLECKRLKRRCDKGVPCGQCAKANRNCEYRDPADDGLYGPISQAKDINSVAFGTLLDILVNRPRVLEAASLYFNGVHTWFPIIDRFRLEQELETSWNNLPAETSVVVLCMALVARPPAPKSNKGISDAAYSAVRAILSTVRCAAGLSVPLLQSELLLALYEVAQGKPQQAYFSVGLCLQMIKALGWLDPAFWSLENKVSRAKELKLFSTLWWATVYVDCLLNVGYEGHTYAMHTMGLTNFSRLTVPFPSEFDPYLCQLGPQDNAEAAAAALATSAWDLSAVLQHLATPDQSVKDPKFLAGQIWGHATESNWPGAAVIALLKLNTTGPYRGMDFITMTGPIHTTVISTVSLMVDLAYRKAISIQECQEPLQIGAVDPCWGFAMFYASKLLINGVFQDADFVIKATQISGALNLFAQRWRIGEQYCTAVQSTFDNPFGGAARPATSSGLSRSSSLVFAMGPQPGNSSFGRRTSA